MLPELTQLDSLRVFMTCDATSALWHHALDLAQGLRAYETSTTLCVLGAAPGPDQQGAARRVPGLKLNHLELSRGWATASPHQVLEAAERVAAMARAEGARLVHLHSPLLASGPAFVAPVVTACHECIPTWCHSVRSQPFDHALDWHKNDMATGLLRSDTVIAPTGAFAKVLTEVYGLPKPPMVVHSGRRPSTRESLPEGRGIPATSFVFTAAQLWDEGKDLRTLDEAAANVKLPVYVAGSISGLAGETPIAPNPITPNHVHFLGDLSDGHLAEWLTAKPIFVSTACYEPFGMIVLEAAESGCPLILSDIPTFRELWEGAAEFVPCGDSGATAAAIEAVAGDSALRARLASAARRRARRYTAEVMAAKVRAIYGGLLRRPPAARQRAGSEVAA